MKLISEEEQIRIFETTPSEFGEEFMFINNAAKAQLQSDREFIKSKREEIALLTWNTWKGALDWETNEPWDEYEKNFSLSLSDKLIALLTEEK